MVAQNPIPHSPPRPPPLAGETREQVLQVVRALYVELHHTERGVDDLDLDSTLERELGFDSLARVELLLRLEQQCNVHLPESTLAAAETVGDLLHAVIAASIEGSAAAPVPLQAPATNDHGSARPGLGVPSRAATLNEVLDWRVRSTPDATHAIVLQAGRAECLTYQQLQAGARVVAGALTNAGLPAGATVALMLPTSAGYLHVFLGVLLAGAIPVPIYPPTRPSQLEEHVRRHAGILTNAGVDTLVTIPEARLVARFLKARVPSVRAVLSIDELMRGPSGTATHAPAADSIAMLQYTSGSTGDPKGVVLTHAELLANIRAMGRAVSATDSDVFVSWLPLYHDMGLIGAWLGSLYFGCLFVVMPPTSFLARPAGWLRAIQEHRATLSASPNFGYELCVRRLSDEDLAGLDLSSWRIAFNGAEAVSPDTLERFARRFAPYGFKPQSMTPVYGLAEAAVGLTFPPTERGPLIDCVDRRHMMDEGRAVPVAAAQPDALRFVSCGRPLPGYEVRVLDSDGSEAAERVEGTVEFRGPSATAGYFSNPRASAQLRRAGWLDTGDRGYLASSELFITGRVKDIVIRRGRHIYPEEIERAVGELEGIRRGCVAAFGTRETTNATEKLVIVAETRDTDAASLAQLRARINRGVVALVGEPPEEILLVAPHSVLKTSSGKLRRAATRIAYEDGTLARGPTRAGTQWLRLTVASAVLEARRLLRAAQRSGYGLYCWLAALPFALAFGVLSVLFPGRASSFGHRAARWLIGTWRIPLNVTGMGNPGLATPHIVVANHCSYLDFIFITALLPGVHLFVAKAELQRVPLLGTWLRRVGTVFVERFAAEQSVRAVAQLRETLVQGHSLVIFPEGTFTRASGLRPFHLGAFQVAVACGVPIIPLSLRGTRSALRDGQRLMRRVPVSAALGAPLWASPEGDVFAEAVRLRDAAREFLVRHCGELDLTGD
jgi:1-acyl-sn-glycerol-3-phosphate acyltransferase